MKYFMYDKKDVEALFLKIKDIFQKDTEATIVVTDVVKAMYSGLAEGVEELHDFFYLKYQFKNENIFVIATFDVTPNDNFFIHDFYFKNSEIELDIYNITYSKTNQYYI